MTVVGDRAVAAPTDLRARRLAVAGPVLGSLCAVAAVAGLALAYGPGGRSLDGLMHDNVLNNAVNGVVLGLLGGWLTRLRPLNAVCWLMLALAVSNTVTILGEGWALASYQVELPGRLAMAWLGSWMWAPGFVANATLLPVLYPSGRPTSRPARWLAVAGLVACVGVAVSVGLLDQTFSSAAPGHHLGPNPLSGGRFQHPLQALAMASSLLAGLVALLAWAHTLRRLWRAATPEREQIAWLLVSVIPVALGAMLAPAWLFFVINVVSPVGIAVGIVRYRLFDIKVVLRSGLVYGLLTGFAVAAYFGVVGAITRITPAGTVPNLFAAAVVGLLVLPAHRVLQRGVGRLVYGDRGDPVRALSRVAEGIRDSPTDLSPMLAGIATALRSPYVAVTGDDGTPLASVGAVDAGHPLQSVPLEYDGTGVGRLEVAGRTARNPLTGADRALLDALSGPVAAAVRAGLLTEQVTRSRERVIAARESERRRLRSDLHDGLGPSLSGVALGLEAARSAAARDPRRVEEILGVLHGEVGSLVAEVRQIIADLGPADVDLMAALRAHAETVTSLGVLQVRVSQSSELPVLTGAVAVAAQRIAGEALTNVVRHAGATRAAVQVGCVAGQLVVEVTDDGSGFDGSSARPGAGTGVGLGSMRERAESVGGVLHIVSAPGQGTRVTATIPVRPVVPEAAREGRP